MIRRPPRSTQSRSSAASDVYKRQPLNCAVATTETVQKEAIIALRIFRKELPHAKKLRTGLALFLSKTPGSEEKRMSAWKKLPLTLKSKWNARAQVHAIFEGKKKTDALTELMASEPKNNFADYIQRFVRERGEAAFDEDAVFNDFLFERPITAPAAVGRRLESLYD
eukprot:TRINITY_DN7270_c0_g1_i1.p1 TRINITY_DN7270_c0_g1~~TRINITY_DN7270_c0_g1_i1.p1  ORF type:complete len:167 (+),score=47.83 TRINITY_DN7270_c0_g1_i1:11-511(+)